MTKTTSAPAVQPRPSTLESWRAGSIAGMAALCLTSMAAQAATSSSGNAATINRPPAPRPVQFRKITLTRDFWAEAAAIGDVDRDGHGDVVVGPYWFAGPGFKKARAYASDARTFTSRSADGKSVTRRGFDGISGTVVNSDMHFVAVRDLNADGWPDILAVGLLDGVGDASPKAFWYKNPGPSARLGSVKWSRYLIADQADNFSLMEVDLLKTGKPVLLCVSGGVDEQSPKQVGYLEQDGQAPEKPWKFHPVSSPASQFKWHTHGLGHGDINGDGRNDILHSDGWWQQPASLVDDPVWPYRPYPLNLGPKQIRLLFHYGDEISSGLFDVTPDGIATYAAGAYGGSQMYVDDFNRDGLADVVTSLAAHGYGLAWWEQLQERDRILGIRFRRHMIMSRPEDSGPGDVTFSQPQALAFADIDGDGSKDLVTGKRYWSHGSAAKSNQDPDSDGPAVLYWFERRHDAKGRVTFRAHLIDANSGAGAQISVGDVNGDGRADIAVSNKKGAFLFIQV